MLRFLILLCALIVLPRALVAQRVSEREGLSAEIQADWPAVGRLNVQGKGFCTGTLIAPDLVLTAGHCLQDIRLGRTVSPRLVHFLPGFRAGAFAHHGRAAAVAVADPDAVRDVALGLDLGLVRLTEPVPDTIRPMPLAPAVETGQRLFSLSYGMDRSQVLSRQETCKITRRSGLLLGTDCEGISGVSGAPLLSAGTDPPELAAIAVALPGKGRVGPRKGLIALYPDARIIAWLQSLVTEADAAQQPIE